MNHPSPEAGAQTVRAHQKHKFPRDCELNRERCQWTNLDGCFRYGQ